VSSVPPYRTTACRGCGKQVLFVRDATGVTVPLDPAPPVWHRIYDPDDGRHFWIKDGSASGERTAFVSHFATCTRANDFSKGGKQQ
jgi:SH3-like domain-containing protein